MKLKAGESIRGDGRFQFRYTDSIGKRRTIYARKLSDLREKEKATKEGRVVSFSRLTVMDYVQRYTEGLRGLSAMSQRALLTKTNRIKRADLSRMRIGDVRFSDARRYASDLISEGLGRSSISGIVSILRRSFALAVEDYLIAVNPFSFSLRELGMPKAGKRNALSNKETADLLEFLANDTIGKRHYDMFLILLNSGLRVSELCGLRIADLDFEKGLIRVDHQVQEDNHGRAFVQGCKTEAGRRVVPISKQTEASLRRVIEGRKAETEPILKDAEGREYSGFLFLDTKGGVRTGRGIDQIFRSIEGRYNKTHPQKISYLRPHVLRHTFCTNMLEMGMPIKSLQFVAGHSTVRTTLDIYGHMRGETAIKDFRELFREN